jgi:hypothetical protein
MSNLPALFLRRWNDYYDGSRFLLKQMKEIGLVVESEEARALSKSAAKNVEDGEVAGDELFDSGGADSEMKWKKSGKKKTKKKLTIVMELEMYKSRLDKALATGKSLGKLSYCENSLRSKWVVVKNYVEQKRGGSGDFMGHVKFTEWYNGLRETELKSKWVDTIKSVCSTYMTSADGAGKDAK